MDKPLKSSRAYPGVGIQIGYIGEIREGSSNIILGGGIKTTTIKVEGLFTFIQFYLTKYCKNLKTNYLDSSKLDNYN